jgi:cell wall assembly regulator SMI1
MPKRTPPAAPIHEVWDRLEAAVRTAAPDVLKSLRKGTAEAKVAKAEQKIGAELPADLRATLLRHDGQKDDADGLIPEDFVEEWSGEFLLMPAAEIASDWAMWQKLTASGEFADAETTPGKGVQPGWWNAGWVPFATDGGGDYLCVDSAPAKGGVVGQVILMKHDGGGRPVLARSLAAFLLTVCTHYEEHAEEDEEDE